MDWSKLPDLGAVALLTTAFASVARRGRTAGSKVWLTAWLMVVLHFAASIFVPVSGFWGEFALFVSISSLVSGGVLFMWAAVPYRTQLSSLWMLATLLGTYALYIALLFLPHSSPWAMNPPAILIGTLPLLVALIFLRQLSHPLRAAVVALNVLLSIFLLAVQNHPGYGPELALNGILFTVYLGCGIHFWYAYRRASAGAFITIAGFFAWSSVFVIGPSILAIFPGVHLEDEVWNLPKYIVAVGMILLLLEDQLEYNKYLALHDELTGLPNRRLFQDRLITAIERARRTGSQVALLLVDLDHFKQVNDTVGHHAGDELLKHVSNLFIGRVRRSDTVARTGGDEFSVILDEPMCRADAVRVGQSLTKLLDEPFDFEGQTVRVGASVGIALYPDDATDAESLCIAADVRMYAGKNGGARPVAAHPRKTVASESSPLAQQPKTGTKPQGGPHSAE